MIEGVLGAVTIGPLRDTLTGACIGMMIQREQSSEEIIGNALSLNTEQDYRNEIQ